MHTGAQHSSSRRPRGIVILGVFMLLATCIAMVSAVSLLLPGSALDRAWWSLNPPARAGFARLGALAAPLLFALAVAAACAGVGLLRGKRWAWWFAVVGLAVNLVGDLGRLVATGEVLAGLVGVAVVAALLAYLASPGVRRYFGVGR
jgi:hypothetical protein